MLNTKKQELIGQIVALGLVLAFGLLPIVTDAQVLGADTRENVRTTREAMAKDKIGLFGEKAITRLTAALNRADGLRQRVALHASQFPNPKFDKTIVDQKLAEAVTAITKGRTAVATIQVALENALTEGGVAKNGSFADVRMVIREAMASIRTAHQKVVDAIKLIKAGYPPVKLAPEATTTTP